MGGTSSSASVRTRPWQAGAPGLSRPSPTLKGASKTRRKLQRRLRTAQGGLKNAKEASKTIKNYGLYFALCLGAWDLIR